jgi:hypothetical protein
MTAAETTLDAQARDESLSRSQTPGKSKSSFRLYFFTFLSVLGCALALANVASAATPSGEDQYLEQAPNGGGEGVGQGVGLGADDVETPVDANNDGVITEAEVKEAAERNKKKAAANDDEGSSGATGAATGTTPTPPAAESVATAAKIGPLSQKTALMLAGLSLLVGGGAVVFGGAGGGLFGLGSGVGGGTPPAGQ